MAHTSQLKIILIADSAQTAMVMAAALGELRKVCLLAVGLDSQQLKELGSFSVAIICTKGVPRWRLFAAAFKRRGSRVVILGEYTPRKSKSFWLSLKVPFNATMLRNKVKAVLQKEHSAR